MLEVPQVDPNHQAAIVQPHEHGRSTETLILLATGLALAVWVLGGAFRWQGYPVDHPWGAAVTAVVGLAAVLVLAGIGRLAVRPIGGTFATVAIALIGWSFCRLALASLFPVISDEAYHWMWGKYLDLGYFDHPGMVAWMGRLFAPFHGRAAALVRLSPIGLSAGIALLTWLLARMTTGNSRIAARSALLLLLVPIFSVGFMLLIPSVSLNLFWLLMLVLFWRATQGNRLADWILAGLACGASFNCNFTAFSFPVCALAYLLISQQTRRLLRQPGPYIAAAVSLAAFTPTLVWNARHQWITLVWNLYLRQDPTRLRLDGLGAFLGGLIFFVSPILVVLMIWVGGRTALKGWRDGNRGTIFLAVMGFSQLAGWLVISGVKFIVAYYAAPAFVPLLILCVRGGVDDDGQWVRPWQGRWCHRAAIIACGETTLVFAIFLLPVFVPADVTARFARMILPETFSTRVGEVYSWSAFGRYLDSFNTSMTAKTPLVVFGSTYAQSSLAMYYSHHVDMAYCLDEGTGRYGQEFAIWAPLEELPLGCDAIVFRPGRSDHPANEERRLLQFFDRVQEQAIDDPRMKYFTVLRAYGYKGGMSSEALVRPLRRR